MTVYKLPPVVCRFRSPLYLESFTSLDRSALELCFTKCDQRFTGCNTGCLHVKQGGEEQGRHCAGLAKRRCTITRRDLNTGRKHKVEKMRGNRRLTGVTLVTLHESPDGHQFKQVHLGVEGESVTQPAEHQYQTVNHRARLSIFKHTGRVDAMPCLPFVLVRGQEMPITPKAINSIYLG
ncbi:hypothetical protein HAX54_002520 [Datura stramonium]|uniref:Uncharacterized protein n=1 Tax=Datura stramonium TaxID=4076 RepID=A0ABS8WW78_DATST|nr:hypothetical protein [Datura stramonium]